MGINKKLTEADVKFRYINDAITSKGWEKGSIFMEHLVKLTDGKINLHGNFVHRDSPKYADYVLYANKATPIAIIEAKDANHSVSHGLQQAMTYAQMLDVKFAYSSNGEGFAEHDFFTGKERIFTLEEFPTKDELIERYKNEANNGKGLGEQELAVLNQPFCTGQNIFPPRYYQRIAVNRTSGYLFLNRFGERITTRGISQQLKNYAVKCGLNEKVVYPHSFRHRFAKNFLEKFNDIALLADLMGHESIETTRIYLRRTASKQQKVVDKVVNW